MSEIASAELLSTLFDPRAQYLSLKKEAISKLESTFQFLDLANFGSYIEYLIEWTLFEVNSECLEIFIYKIQDLQLYLQTHLPLLQEKVIMVLFYLLQQEDPQVRKCAIEVAVEIFKSQYGQTYRKNSIIELLKNGSNCSGFDAALVLFKEFRREFIADNEFVEIINNPCFLAAFKTKKIFLVRMLEISEEFIQIPLLKHLLQITPLYIKDQDEIIHCLSIKLRIVLLAQASKHNLVNLNDRILELIEYYKQPLIRTKFVLIESTDYIVCILPPHLIRKHFEYLKQNINPLESEITELAIDKLKIMFQYVSKEQRKELMNYLIKLEKDDYHIGDAIARNITDLLIQEENETALIDYLKEFVSEQKDVVKLSLLKSFFNHQKSKHWYNFLLNNLQQLMENKVWRIRLESLHILRKVMEIFPVQNWMFPTLKRLMFDKVFKIRLQTVKLLAICVNQENVKNQLISSLLEEAKNRNYLIRETVLFFIKETCSLVTEDIRKMFKSCIEILKQDPVQNVREIAFEILKSY